MDPRPPISVQRPARLIFFCSVSTSLTLSSAYAPVTNCDMQGYVLDRKRIPSPGFLDSCQYLGYIEGECRWRAPDDGFLFTWDALHGEVEAFDKRGRHIGVLDAVTGNPIKPMRKGRRIRV